MKHIIYLSAIVLAITSCTTKLQLPVEPEVNQGVSAVTVTIPSIQLVDAATSAVIPGEGTHRWNNLECLGILSGETTNARFILRKSYDRKAGEVAEFYGEPLFGTLTGYIPWNETPTLIDSTEQKFYADAYEHFMNNSLLSGTIADGSLELAYSGGMLKVSCSEQLGLVESIRIYTNSWEATVIDIDRQCSPSSPLTIWVNIPAGKYSNFNVTYNCSGRRVSIPAPGEFTIEDFHCASVKVEQQTYHHGIDPFTGEDAGYSDKPLDY